MIWSCKLDQVVQIDFHYLHFPGNTSDLSKLGLRIFLKNIQKVVIPSNAFRAQLYWNFMRGPSQELFSEKSILISCEQLRNSLKASDDILQSRSLSCPWQTIDDFNGFYPSHPQNLIHQICALLFRRWLFAYKLLMAQPIVEIICSIELTIDRVSSLSALHSIELLSAMQWLELLYALIMDFLWCVEVLQRVRLLTWPQLFNHYLLVLLVKDLVISEFGQVRRRYSLLFFLLHNLLLHFDDSGLSCIISEAFHYSDKKLQHIIQLENPNGKYYFTLSFRTIAWSFAVRQLPLEAFLAIGSSSILKHRFAWSLPSLFTCFFGRFRRRSNAIGSIHTSGLLDCLRASFRLGFLASEVSDWQLASWWC